MSNENKTIFLCGFMGCGKSHIARILAAALNLRYADMDKHIVINEDMSIPEIFNQKGEEYFRELEAKYITTFRNAVVATGGGALVNDRTAEYAKKTGTVIFLDADFEICYERIKDDSNRPLVQSNTKNQLHKLFLKRREIYKRNSVYSVDANGTPENIVEQILMLFTD